jgi:hypothetical protein
MNESAGVQERKTQKRKKGPDDQLSVSAISALSPEHPLDICVINGDWRKAHMANIIIARKTPGGFAAVGFLVDTWGVGLKDGFMHKSLSRTELDQLLSMAGRNFELVECPLSLAQKLVYGGLAWARQNGFRVPSEVIRSLRILPAPTVEPDLSGFGAEDGKPVLVGTLANIKKFLTRQ